MLPSSCEDRLGADFCPQTTISTASRRRSAGGGRYDPSRRSSKGSLDHGEEASPPCCPPFGGRCSSRRIRVLCVFMCRWVRRTAACPPCLGTPRAGGARIARMLSFGSSTFWTDRHAVVARLAHVTPSFPSGPTGTRTHVEGRTAGGQRGVERRASRDCRAGDRACIPCRVGCASIG